MILIRKASRLAVLTATMLAIAYFGLNQVHGELASILVIYASVELPFQHWASIWPAPQEEWPQHSID